MKISKSTTKPGRPKFPDPANLKTRPMTIVLSEDTYLRLNEYALQNRRSKAAMVRLIVEDTVKGMCA